MSFLAKAGKLSDAVEDGFPVGLFTKQCDAWETTPSYQLVSKIVLHGAHHNDGTHDRVISIGSREMGEDPVAIFHCFHRLVILVILVGATSSSFHCSSTFYPYSDGHCAARPHVYREHLP